MCTLLHVICDITTLYVICMFIYGLLHVDVKDTSYIGIQYSQTSFDIYIYIYICIYFVHCQNSLCPSCATLMNSMMAQRHVSSLDTVKLQVALYNKYIFTNLHKIYVYNYNIYIHIIHTFRFFSHAGIVHIYSCILMPQPWHVRQSHSALLQFHGIASLDLQVELSVASQAPGNFHPESVHEKIWRIDALKMASVSANW